jgi:hypothetical protein
VTRAHLPPDALRRLPPGDVDPAAEQDVDDAADAPDELARAIAMRHDDGDD